jgi:ABC-type dipeptide/oligopeptide/nickel transport system permease subunit
VKARRIVALFFLAVLVAVSFGASLVPKYSYSVQHREFTDAPPSLRFPLGTDDLGRDRMARLLYASRVSLLFAAAASFGALLLAALLGGAAGYWGGWVDRCLKRAIDLMLSLPWLFLLLAARAVLPLNASPITSLIVTYALLALLGWASPARVVRAGVRAFRDSEFVLQARAEGISEMRILVRQVLPNLRPILLAQFWTSIPIFILTEANLGFLGLSAGEPFPTWGSLLQDLQSPLLAGPAAFAPVIAIALSVCCFRLLSPRGGLQA